MNWNLKQTFGMLVAALAVFISAPAAQAATDGLAAALTRALAAESQAQEFYAAAADAYGTADPFTQLADSAERHVATLSKLRSEYGYADTPPVYNELALPADYDTALAAAYTIEEQAVALYDELAASVDDNYALLVFENLQFASYERHLPMLDAYLAGEAWEHGAGPGSGNGNGNGAGAGLRQGSGQGRGKHGKGWGGHGSGQRYHGQGTYCAWYEGLDAPMDDAEFIADKLHDALMDEYHALSFYAAVMAEYGEIAPFVNIARSEEQHISALSRLYEKYGRDMPENPYGDGDYEFASLEDAATMARDAEIANAELYDELVAGITDEDVLRVFANLQYASMERHLPAFERYLDAGCLADGSGRGNGQRGGGGSGNGPRDGSGNGPRDGSGGGPCTEQ